MRLFVAVTPPGHVLDRLEAATVRARTDWAGLRWTRREQWHLTLAFYGELDGARLPALTRRLTRAAGRTAPPDLALTGAGAFPDASRAQVLWAGVRGDLTGLRGLADAAASAGRDLGVPRERKPFRAHLTLARCRAPADLRALVTSLDGFDSGWWSAGELLLVRSHTGPRPRYELLGSWRLDGAER